MVPAGRGWIGRGADEPISGRRRAVRVHACPVVRNIRTRACPLVRSKRIDPGYPIRRKCRAVYHRVIVPAGRGGDRARVCP
ncbi:hypothetical protein NHU_01496 [Rhodovulum sulfidophilum]|uniref:Uncharacterized protein n=1 Tax=Rhodovulum sulfidophilum TaxID=35806 RepID=A0A0D6B1U7_RHOSU|nr:hypothetical protein NHU_01496 [Rhodovulum sulfidophilum]